MPLPQHLHQALQQQAWSLWSGQAAQQLGNGRAFRRHQSSHGRILAHQTDAKDNGEEAQLELLAILHESSSLAQLHLASSAQSEPYVLLAEQAQLAPFRVPVELLAPLELLVLLAGRRLELLAPLELLVLP